IVLPRQPSDLSSSFKIPTLEVFRLVQAGEEVPGLSKLDIKPNNQTPTPSQMERRPKPWENSKTHITTHLRPGNGPIESDVGSLLYVFLPALDC
uniref:Peroxisomal membrane protein PEX14-like KPWE domain-containing protein n=1 Tax=Oncorhynchus mykiss TaxID=8022 RepID=A0A8C7VLE7_ONCMY